MSKLTLLTYLVNGEKPKKCTAKHKQHIVKVMFLAAVAWPHSDAVTAFLTERLAADCSSSKSEHSKPQQIALLVLGRWSLSMLIVKPTRSILWRGALLLWRKSFLVHRTDQRVYNFNMTMPLLILTSQMMIEWHFTSTTTRITMGTAGYFSISFSQQTSLTLAHSRPSVAAVYKGSSKDN